MAYPEANLMLIACMLSWRGEKNPLKKSTLHIFDDVGVAAAEL